MFAPKIASLCSRRSIQPANLLHLSALPLQSSPPSQLEVPRPVHPRQRSPSAPNSHTAKTVPAWDGLEQHVGADALVSCETGASAGASRRGIHSGYARLVSLLCEGRWERKLVRLLSELIRCCKGSVPDVLTVVASVGKGSSGRGRPVAAVGALMKAYAGLSKPNEALDAFLRLGDTGLVPCVKTCNFLMNFLFEFGGVKNVRVVYDRMKWLGMEMNSYTYAIFIKALCKEEEFQEAFGVVREMKEMGLEPDEFIYTTLINGWCAAGKPDSGYELLKTVRRAGVDMKAFSYNCVIHGLCKQGRLQEATGILEEMRRHGVVGDASGHGCIIRELGKAGDLWKAISLHEDMKSKNIRTNSTIVSSILHGLCEAGMCVEVLELFHRAKVVDRIFVDEVLYNIAMDAHCKLGSMTEALDLLQEMKRKQLFPDALHYTTLIRGFCRKGDLSHAWKVFADMLKTGAEPDVVTYNMLAGGCCKNGCLQEVVDIMDHILDCGLNPDSISYSIIIEALCRRGDLHKAVRLFESLKNKDFQLSVISSAMVTGFLVVDRTEEAHGLFFSTCEQGVLVDEIASSMLISKLCSNSGDAERACMVFEKMLAMGRTPNEVSYNKLIAALARTGNMRKARHLFDDFVTRRGLQPNVIMYTTLMNGYCRVNLLAEAHKLFWEMREKGIKPDVVSYTVLIDAHLKEISRKGHSAKQNGGQSEIGSPYHELLLKEMLELQIKPDTVCFTVLVDGKVDCLDDALELFNTMVDVGVIPDVVTYTALICSCCGRGMVEKARDLFEEMVGIGVQPDPATFNALNQGILKAKKLQLQKQTTDRSKLG